MEEAEIPVTSPSLEGFSFFIRDHIPVLRFTLVSRNETCPNVAQRLRERDERKGEKNTSPDSLGHRSTTYCSNF
jgi:hypothetical protein